MNPRYLPRILIIVGLVIWVAGFIYDVRFAGIPYQDPTPEMAAHYAHHAHIAAAIEWIGVGFLVAGAVGWIILHTVRRFWPPL